MAIVVSKSNSVLSRFVAQIRDKDVQTDSMRFRRNLERIGEVMAYEVSKCFDYSTAQVETPLGVAEMELISDQIVVATIMRAGIPFHNGVLNYFDDASCAFVSAYRKSHKSNAFEIKLEYVSCGSIEGRVLIIADPMLATGSSLVLAYRALCERGGEPKHTHILAAIASEQGVDYLKKNLPNDRVTVWTAALDEELTSRYYIVPGIGDAGDLAYGEKL